MIPCCNEYFTASNSSLISSLKTPWYHAPSNSDVVNESIVLCVELISSCLPVVISSSTSVSLEKAIVDVPSWISDDPKSTGDVAQVNTLEAFVVKSCPVPPSAFGNWNAFIET